MRMATQIFFFFQIFFRGLPWGVVAEDEGLGAAYFGMFESISFILMKFLENLSHRLPHAH